MIRSPLALVTLLLVLLISPSCQSSSLVNSLDDLTAQVDRQGFLTLQQQRIISLSGLVPSGPPGTIYRFRNSRSPFTAIGVSARKDPSSDERRSYYLTREIALDGVTLEDLLALRDQLVDVRVKAAELIRQRVERLALLAAQEEDQPPAGLESLETSIESAQDDFNTAWGEAIKAVQKPGILIIRTDKKVSRSLAARVGEILGLSGQDSRETGGFAILGGLRTSFLFVGTDLESERWAQPPGSDWSLIGTRFPFILGTMFPFIGQWNHEDMQVVTSKLEAQHVLYARDQLSESQIQANLKASMEQLRKAGKTLQEVDEVAIEAVLNAVESLGNVGIIGEATQSVTELSATPPSGTVWQTVYQVQSDYNDLLITSRDGWRFHLSRLR